MHIKSQECITTTVGNQNQNQELTIAPHNDPIQESKAGTSTTTTPDTNPPTNMDEEPSSILKQYHGREWSEVAHILQVPSEPEKDDNENNEWSSAVSQVSTDSHDDPLAEDIHDLVNALDDMIRARSNLNCDATRIVEFLDLDIYKYETMLDEVERWDWDSEDFFAEESLTNDLDTVNT